MARGKSKLAEGSIDDQLEKALVPDWEQPYDLPKNWCWVKFGHLAKDMADGPFGSNLKTEHYIDEPEARIIQLSNIGENGWREENTKYTSFSHAKEIRRSVVEPNDIVIAKMMPAGRAIICPNNERMYVLSSDAVKYVPHQQLNRKFMLLGINTVFFQNQVKENTQGITRARTSIKKLRECSFPLPPLAEQQRIVDRIESLFAKLDEAKEKLQEVVDGFETRKAAILHRAFTGEMTAQWREEHGIGMESWDDNTLGKLCKISSGGTPSRSHPEYYGGSIPWIKTGEINWNDIYKAEETITTVGLKNSSAKVYEPNTILVAMYGQGLTRGRAAILRISAAVNQAVCALIPNEELSSNYLFYYFMCNYWELRKLAVGGNQPNFSATIISKFKIIVPKIVEQHEIVRLLDTLIEKERQTKETAEATLDQIDIIKKSILARAFRGELGTNDPSEDSAVNLLRTILGEEEKQEKRYIVETTFVEVEKMNLTLTDTLKVFGRLSPEELKGKTELEVDEFYSQLKQLIDDGLVIETRDDGESYLESIDYANR